MKFTSAVILAAAIGQASAGAISHRHNQGKVHNHALRHAEIKRAAQTGAKVEKRSVLSTMESLGAKVASSVSGAASSGSVWIGNTGPYTNTFSNDAGEDLVLYCWGPAGSWINAVPPLISQPMPANSTLTVSFAEGATGACAHAVADTTMVNGQLFQTWLEYTFAGVWSTYDISREVNMNGRPISTKHVLADGQTGCVSDMSTCVFVCADASLPQCTTGYQLLNCNAANGGGTGTDAALNAPAGGCNGLSGGAGNLYTSLQ